MAVSSIKQTTAYQAGETITHGGSWITIPGMCYSSGKTIEFTIPIIKSPGSRTYTLSRFTGTILKPGGGSLGWAVDYLNTSGCTASVIKSGTSSLIVRLDFDSTVDIAAGDSMVSFYGAFTINVS